MAIHPKDESLDPLLVPIMSVSTKALCSRPVDDTIQMLAETIAVLMVSTEPKFIVDRTRWHRQRQKIMRRRVIAPIMEYFEIADEV